MATRGFTLGLSAARGWLPLLTLPAAVLAFTPSDWPRSLFMGYVRLYYAGLTVRLLA